MAEGARLESVFTLTCNEGSNPSLSATVLAHELELNKQYEVVLTTSGGLYRYKLRDIIEVMGFDEGVPLFRFVGKAGYISDLFEIGRAHV